MAFLYKKTFKNFGIVSNMTLSSERSTVTQVYDSARFSNLHYTEVCIFSRETTTFFVPNFLAILLVC
jgi:hypothetical protein